MISVIPIDGVIVVDGVAVFGKEVKKLLPPNVHALQFNQKTGKGELEYTDAVNQHVTAEDVDLDSIIKMHSDLAGE